MLVNLLSNAAKFTDAPAADAPGGTAAVTVDVASREAGAGGADDDRPEVVFLRVRDTGHGIAREQQERVFEPFVQVGRRFAGDAPGTGLGLAISRDLARGMGGDLSVESTVGEGSTFRVALRRVVASGEPLDRRAGEERRGAEEERRRGEARDEGRRAST